MSSIKIVCLANSRRPGGHCIAGKVLKADSTLGNWVRPVSENGGVADADVAFEDGNMPKNLDIISVSLLKHAPSNHQVENYINDKKYYWGYHGVYDKRELENYLDTPATLWENGHGYKNDRVPVATAQTLDVSLYLIKPVTFDILVMDFLGKKVVKSDILYNGVHYCFAITDTVIEKEYLAKDSGSYRLDNILCCVSLAEQPYKGDCYKLVASIIR
jgi:hypothetical protein